MKNKRIVFLGTHGQMNIGDELLLETFLTQLGRDNHYYVNSYDPQFTGEQLRAQFQARGRSIRPPNAASCCAT